MKQDNFNRFEIAHARNEYLLFDKVVEDPNPVRSVIGAYCAKNQTESKTILKRGTAKNSNPPKPKGGITDYFKAIPKPQWEY